MIRHLHPTDSPGLLQFSKSSGRGETCTLVGALQGGPSRFPTVKYATIALSPRAWQSCWVEARRGRIDGVLRAGPRSGPEAWEVSELYVRNTKSELALDLLEQIAVPAGGAGSHRIFIRIPTDSDLFDYARKAGYMALYRESVFVAQAASTVQSKLGFPDHPLKLRPRIESDEQALFKMHNSVTPVEVRMKLGQTLKDWSSSNERLSRKTGEWVLDLSNGEIGALIHKNSTRSGHTFTLNWSTQASYELPGLVTAALAESKDGQVSTIVPEYRPELSHLLVTLGFTEQAQYEIMVKPLTQQVAESKKAFAAIS
tara:strand:- start:2499 stop:3437 length:939 start_codon:yes stop_codon:yes gene_type:complete